MNVCLYSNPKEEKWIIFTAFTWSEKNGMNGFWVWIIWFDFFLSLSLSLSHFVTSFPISYLVGFIFQRICFRFTDIKKMHKSTLFVSFSSSFTWYQLVSEWSQRLSLCTCVTWRGVMNAKKVVAKQLLTFVWFIMSGHYTNCKGLEAVRIWFNRVKVI